MLVDERKASFGFLSDFSPTKEITPSLKESWETTLKKMLPFEKSVEALQLKTSSFILICLNQYGKGYMCKKYALDGKYLDVKIFTK